VWEALRQLQRGSAPTCSDPEVRAATATALGALAAACPPERLPDILGEGPCGPAAQGTPAQREAAAMLLAAVAGAAGGRLEGAGQLPACVQAALAFSRDADAAVKVAAGRAVSRLFLAAPEELLGPLGTVMTALLGPDQGSETQRQAMLALQRVAAAGGGGGGAARLAPLLPGLLPSVCGILAGGPNSQLKAAAEQLLKHALGLGVEGAGLEGAQAAAAAAGGSAKAFLTDAYLRRLQARPHKGGRGGLWGEGAALDLWGRAVAVLPAAPRPSTPPRPGCRCCCCPACRSWRTTTGWRQRSTERRARVARGRGRACAGRRAAAGALCVSCLCVPLHESAGSGVPPEGPASEVHDITFEQCNSDLL
jgi:hypothetical protein